MTKKVAIILADEFEDIELTSPKEAIENAGFETEIVGDTANQRPDVTRLNSLVAYLKAPLSIPISCHFLEELNISSVVIESYKLGQREGARNIIDIEINMLSDSVIELSSNNTQKDIFTNRAFF